MMVIVLITVKSPLKLLNRGVGCIPVCLHFSKEWEVSLFTPLKVFRMESHVNCFCCYSLWLPIFQNQWWAESRCSVDTSGREQKKHFLLLSSLYNTLDNWLFLNPDIPHYSLSPHLFKKIVLVFFPQPLSTISGPLLEEFILPRINSLAFKV